MRDRSDSGVSGDISGGVSGDSSGSAGQRSDSGVSGDTSRGSGSGQRLQRYQC